jgi:hypothetical protein
MKICFALLLALGVFTMALGQLQRASEVARWSQIYGIVGHEAASLSSDQQKAIDNAFREDTRIYNGTTDVGVVVFIISGAGLILSFRGKKP